MSYSSFELLDHTRPILVFGRDGQVGKALQFCLKDLKVPVVFLGRSDCDLSSKSSITEVLNRYQPQVIMNAAAYTAVDKAEGDGERELVFAINAIAPSVMAQYISGVANGVLVQYSTDYVFADSKSTAYLETDMVGRMDQLCVYGQSKLAGEQAIKEAFNSVSDARYFILRTSWVYGDGHNFIRTILRLARERDQLEIVADQVGVPTSAQWLAEVGIQMAGYRINSGIYHAVPDGEVSWFGLAVFILKMADIYGVAVNLKLENLLPISTLEYPLPAKRPYNSRMSNKKIKKMLMQLGYIDSYPSWEDQVEKYLKNYFKTL